MMTIQTVAIAIAITAHPTVTVVKMATSGTSESPEFDHFDPTDISEKESKVKITETS
jgi:hypothetical protein